MRLLLVTFLIACGQPDKVVETTTPTSPEATMPSPKVNASGLPPLAANTTNMANANLPGPRIEPNADGSLPTFTTQNLDRFEEKDKRGALFLPPRESSLILKTLALQPGQAVADVGCGPGSMLYPLADKVGDTGKVYAVEVDSKAIDYVKKRLSLSQKRYGRSYPQVQTVLNTLKNVGLPEKSVDAILLRHIQNYITVPPSMGPVSLGKDAGEEQWVAFISKMQREFTKSMLESLRPGGKMLIIDRSRMHNGNGVLAMTGVEKVIERIGGFRLVSRFPKWADPTDWALLYERVD